MIGNQNTGMGNVPTAGQPPGGTGGGSGGFGSDTIVQLPNNAAALVQALRLILTLSNDDAGDEASNWLFQMIRAGATVSAMQFIQEITAHSNSRIQLPDEWNFLVDTNTGFVWWGADTIALKFGGQIFGVMGATGIALNPALNNNNNFFFAGTPAGMFYDLNGRLLLRANGGQVQIGADGALANDATDDFLTLPSCPGVPTGVPANLIAGKIPIVIGETAGTPKLYAYIGGAWVVL